MAQTFYIEADEEIISVVGRLRHTPDGEIVLIVPKRAILMQSIVSLKLLEREARKIGKTVMIVSQDENGRALAEKAGLITRSYQEEQLHHEEIGLKGNGMAQPIFNAPEPTVSFSESKALYALKPENIGSDSFFSPGAAASSGIDTTVPIEMKTVSEMSTATRVPIRDNTPKYQTALNSKQGINPMNAPDVPLRQSIQQPSFASEPKSPAPEKSSFLPSASNAFFTPSASTPKVMPSAPPAQLPTNLDTKMKFIMASIGIIVLLLIGGVSFFLFTPKATITVLPSYSKEQNTFEMRLISAASGTGLTETDSSTLEVPYRIIDEKIEVPLAITPSGVGTNGERRARGKVVIYNAYSGDPQPLVATTRLETESGLVFRLTAGVTVPGMMTIAGKSEPGAIEAEIVADQSGDSSNIAPTTMTIPGFKGSAKYEKFSAKLLSPTTGGSKTGAAGDPLLTVSDIEQARKTAHDTAIELFRQKTEGTLQSGEKIDDGGLELTATPSEEPLLHEGLSGATIQTTFYYQVKATVVSTEAVERAILRVLSTTEKRTTAAGLMLVPKMVTIDTIELIPDFKLGGGKLKATASFVLATHIDTDVLKNELLGKQAGELRTLLDKHPEILKMNLDIKPNLFLKYIPRDKNRVNVVVVDPEKP